MSAGNFRLTELETTSSGLQIGRCYIAPPMPVQGDAVVIQSVLLAKPSNTADRAVNWAIAASAIVILLSIFFWGQP